MRECRLCGEVFEQRGRLTLCLACEASRAMIARFLGVSKRRAEQYVLAGLENKPSADPSWIGFRQQIMEELLSEEAGEMLRDPEPQ